MSFLELAKNRYSVRKYKSDTVKDEDLIKILEAGRLAPTAKNNQPQKIYVVRSEEGLKKLKECSRCTFDAPLVFIFGYDRELESYDIDYDDHRGAVDVDIVQTHMMLESYELGLGTCWVKIFDAKKIREYFNIPGNIKLTAIMPCGYPADDSVPSSRHDTSRPIEEMVEYR